MRDSCGLARCGVAMGGMGGRLLRYGARWRPGLALRWEQGRPAEQGGTEAHGGTRPRLGVGLDEEGGFGRASASAELRPGKRKPRSLLTRRGCGRCAALECSGRVTGRGREGEWPGH